jgi:hypothetical protein
MKMVSEGFVESEVKLQVGDAKQRDVGRGIARIDQRTMQKLGISAGDSIEIVGKRTTSAIAWPAYSEDQDRDIIRIDGFTRKNAGVAITEYVIVKPAKVKEALNVSLAPVDMRINVDEDFTNFVKNRLMDRTLVEGDTTFVIMLGHTIPFTAVNTDPKGIVKVTHKTKLQVLSEPTTEAAELAPELKRMMELRRFAWLKEMEKICASDYVRFRIEGTTIEEETEREALSKAKEQAKTKSESLTVYVDLKEKRGDIGSFKWAKVKPDGTVDYIYPEGWHRICPYCGEPLTAYYGRYYCHKCNKYL